MRAVFVGVCLAVSMSASAFAAVDPAGAEVDQFIKTLGVTPANGAEVASRCDAYATRAVALQSRIEAGQGPATVESVFLPFDALYNLLSTGQSEASLVSETNPSKDIRSAAEACVQKLADIGTSLGLSRAIYDRLSAIDLKAVDPSMRHALERRLGSYRRAGVDRDAATRAKVEALSKAITATGLEFNRNIREDKSEITLTSVDDLAGLPADYIAAHQPGPDGLIHIKTTYTDTFPVLDFAEKEDTRRRLQMAFNTRAYPVNLAVLQRLLEQRYELAQLLGYPTYAHLVLDDKMMGTPERATAFIGEMQPIAGPASERDYALLLARLQKIDPKATAVPRWSTAYLTRLVRMEQFDVDAAEVRKYFPYETTKNGVLQLTQDMFQVEFRPWNTPVWDSSVSAYEVYDQNKLIGRFYLDMHPRDGKYSHAAQFPIRIGIKDRAVPVASLVTNFPPGQELVDHDDVQTFMHEFGHLLHWMFAGGQPLAQQNFGEIEWDFVEAPSQLLEEWMWDYDVLKRFAKDTDGNPIPEALVKKMNAGRMFGEPTGALGQLMLSSVSLNYHNRSPAGLDQDLLYKTEYERFMPYAYIEGTHPQTSFGHLEGYSAIYYTYVWSKAIALDLFSKFDAEGLLNPAVARKYRDTVLARGGSDSADALVSDFLGRPLSLQAYRDYLAGAPAAP